MIKYKIYPDGFWFRIFGYGIGVIDRNKLDMPYSVRLGSRKEIRIGKYGIKLLKP